MTDSDLKRFKDAHRLLYERELGLQVTIFDIWGWMTSKCNAKKVEYKGIVSNSKVECEYYQYLESNMDGTNYDRIEIQPRFELQPKFGKRRSITYIADFSLWREGKLVEVIDVKGRATRVANIKAEIFRYQYRDVNLTWICKAPKYTSQE